MHVTAGPRCATIRRVTNPDRLTGLDASFLALEEGGAHMHVGSVLLFEGDGAAPTRTSSRSSSGGCALVPRYRQKLAFPPLVQSRPGVGRRPALQRRLPRPPHRAAARRPARPSCGGSPGASSPSGSTAPSRCGSCGSSTASATTASRSSPRRTTASSTAISGVDIATVLFDLDARPAAAAAPPEPWVPRPGADAAALLADALVERAGGAARARARRRGRGRAPAAARVAAGAAARRRPGGDRRRRGSPARRARR